MNTSYVMRDLSKNVVPSIMQFDAPVRENRGRKMFELAVFVLGVCGYISILALAG